MMIGTFCRRASERCAEAALRIDRIAAATLKAARTSAQGEAAMETERVCGGLRVSGSKSRPHFEAAEGLRRIASRLLE
jgi:hypothetical protein